MDFQHLVQNQTRSAGIAQTPSGHGIGFGEAIDQNGSFLHARDLRDGNMIPSIGQLTVYFIGNHEKILFQNHFRNGFQILPLHDRPRRVVGEGKDEHLGFIRNGVAELLRRQAELIFRLQIDEYRNRIRQDSTGFIGNVAGLRNQHLISRIDHRAQGDINGFRPSHRDQYLMGGIILQIKPSFQIVADFHLQFLQTGIGGIECPPLFQGINALVPDMPGRIKIRFSDAQ